MNKPFITISHGIQGYFAVYYGWNTEGFYEARETSQRLFVDKASAEPMAKQWAKYLKVDYYPRK